MSSKLWSTSPVSTPPPLKLSPSESSGPHSAPPFADVHTSSSLKNRINTLESQLETSNENLAIAKKATLDANLRATRTRMTLEETLNNNNNTNKVYQGPQNDIFQNHPFHEQLAAEGFTQRSFFVPHSPTYPPPPSTSNINDSIMVESDDDNDPLNFTPVLDAMVKWHEAMTEDVVKSVDALYKRHYQRPAGCTLPKRAGRPHFPGNPFI